jgi:hypothetical protein
MPGMGLEIEGAMQQMPQFVRHNMLLGFSHKEGDNGRYPLLYLLNS